MKVCKLIISLAILTSCLDKKVVVPATLWIVPELKDLPAPLPSEEVVEDVLGSDDYFRQKLETEEVWKYFPGSSNVKVAIVSTGIDYNHEDLAPRIYRNHKELAGIRYNDTTPFNGKDNCGNGYVNDFIGYNAVGTSTLPHDKLGMGTAAAGIIGAMHGNGKGMKGLNQNVTILPIKSIGDDGKVLIPTMIAGIKYALKEGSDIILVQTSNLDLATSRASAAESGSVESILRDVVKSDVILVVNAGNMGAKLDGSKGLIDIFARPEFRDNVVIVTSLNELDQRPLLANFGTSDIFAPYEATTTLPGNKYGKVKGTFISASFVAGTLALAVSSYGNKVDRKTLVRALYEDVASNPISQMSREYYEVLSRTSLNSFKYLSYLSTLVN